MHELTEKVERIAKQLDGQECELNEVKKEFRDKIDHAHKQAHQALETANLNKGDLADLKNCLGSDLEGVQTCLDGHSSDLDEIKACLERFEISLKVLTEELASTQERTSQALAQVLRRLNTLERRQGLVSDAASKVLELWDHGEESDDAEGD